MKPRAQLTHPLFVAALVLLALNDHLLKGSGIVDPAIAGKLSDVAGLLVAPLTLAWLCRVRDGRGWLAAHVAVGIGFALLQLAPVAELVNASGLWRVWADPGDLLALPALVVSHRVFGAPARRPSSAPIGALALVLCAASGGPSEPASRYPFPPAGRLPADVMVRHMGAAEIEIRVSRLAEDTDVGCDALVVDEDARELEVEFDPERRWLLARGDAIPLWDRRGGAVDRECYAVELRDHHGRKWMVAWRHDHPAVRDWAIRLEPSDEAEQDAIRLGAQEGDAPSAPPGVTVRRRE